MVALGVHGAGAEPIRQIEVGKGHYLVSAPAGYENGHRPGVILALHGTNTRAADMMGIWGSLEAAARSLIVAPQNESVGWEDSDADFLAEVFEDLKRRYTFSSERVLLTGHSAGGAMALYVLYEAGFSATAVAVSANYLPPTITGEDIRARADVPIFYAVGREDVNHDRMRRALVLLRNNGAHVKMLTLEIGHVIQRGVIEEAAHWFAETCASRTAAVIDTARGEFEEGGAAIAMRALEGILEQEGYHSGDAVERARVLYGQASLSGNRALFAVRELIAAGKNVEAFDRLSELETKYAGCVWAREPASLRRSLQADPAVVRRLAIRASEARHREAWRLLEQAQKLIAEKQTGRARSVCRLLKEGYADLPQGQRAAVLLRNIEWSGD